MSKLAKLIALGVAQPESERMIGVEFIEASENQSICKWTITEKLLNGNGVTLGGYITAAADIGMAYAVLNVIEMEDSFTSLSINTTFHKPAFIGEVLIKTKIKRRGRTTAYLESELYQGEQLIADATSTVMFLYPK